MWRLTLIVLLLAAIAPLTVSAWGSRYRVPTKPKPKPRPPPPPYKCLSGWTRYDKGNDCLKEYVKPLDWWQARRFCQMRNADLVMINTKDKNIFVKSFVGDELSNSYWLGVRDSNEDGKYTLLNGAVIPFFGQWNEDDDSLDPCIVLDAEKTWSGLSCDKTSRFMCEKKGTR